VDIIAPEIYNMYSQKKHEMNLLKEFKLIEFDADKKRSTNELRNALNVLEKLVTSDFENAFEVLYMSLDKFLLAVESRDLSQADKSTAIENRYDIIQRPSGS
jgi:hypothetical protein